MILKKLLMVIVLALSIFAFTACESEGPAEKAGEKIDETVQKSADKVEETGEAIQEKAEEAGEAIEEKAEEAKEKAKKATQ